MKNVHLTWKYIQFWILLNLLLIKPQMDKGFGAGSFFNADWGQQEAEICMPSWHPPRRQHPRGIVCTFSREQ
jgi:hypothetical protein